MDSSAPPPYPPPGYKNPGSSAPREHGQSQDSVAHDSIDHEILQEANHHEAHLQQYDESPPLDEKTEQQEERALDEHFSWVPQDPPPPCSEVHLTLPVLVPQDKPGLREAFSRAWAPELASHSVRPEEFLQFIDHLNVCKSASPPLQVLNLAGTVLGFTPIPFAQLISLGVSAVSVGGMVATSRVRITRYINRANKEYFAPRGLAVRIAKENLVPQITGQRENAPLLAQFGPQMDPSAIPSLRDRRLMALGKRIAPLEIVGLAPAVEHGNMLDKFSAKMSAHKQERATRKHGKDGPKERGKMEKEMEKLEHEAMKVQREAEKDMRKKPEDMRKIERKRIEEMEKIEEKRAEEQGKYREKVGVGAKDEGKAARKFLWVVVQGLDDVKRSEEAASGAQGL